MDIAYILHMLVPSAIYGGVPGSTEKSYNNLRWDDERPKPSWTEIVEEWPATQQALADKEEAKLNF